MSHPLLTDAGASAHPIWPVQEETWQEIREGLPACAARFAEAQGFEPKPGRHCLLPDADGSLFGVLFGLDGRSAKRPDPFLLGKLPALLPEGAYRLATRPADPAMATLAWLLGSYVFTRYGKKGPKPVRLVAPEGIDAAEIAAVAEAVAMGRDLVNTPANDLGPDGLEGAARRLTGKHGAEIEVIAGDDLLKHNFPMIHAVGRASATPPRLIDIRWGAPGHPRVTLVGKGVTFDTGGLNIKPDAAMLLMKKDMGGAASALALADMVMGADLPVRLRVLVPAVENMISGASFRPGDVLKSRKGLTVEIGNTDAEGRLILADALALADEEEPELLVDFATLTGAARVALGPDLPPFYTEDDALAAEIVRIGDAVNDPVWRLPLWPPYAPLLDSKIADINHISGGAFAGSITAALFLRRFATAARAHVHVDVYAWTPKPQPGRPEGGEVQGARLVYALLKERYASGHGART